MLIRELSEAMKQKYKSRKPRNLHRFLMMFESAATQADSVSALALLRVDDTSFRRRPPL